jgi:hypothetical protein
MVDLERSDKKMPVHSYFRVPIICQQAPKCIEPIKESIVTPASSEDDAVDSETPGSGVDGSRTDQKGPPAATREESG